MNQSKTDVPNINIDYRGLTVPASYKGYRVRDLTGGEKPFISDADMNIVRKGANQIPSSELAGYQA